jgi:phosphotriesterase-related protein
MQAEASINTVAGAIRPDALGRTLMHEHLAIGMPGWESDSFRRGPGRAERLAICVDRIEEIKALGYRSMVDPCPNDLGRDVEFMAEVAQRTAFNIICATGLYKQSEGGHAYWSMKAYSGSCVEQMTELFIREITEGVPDTGVRAGVIKVATGHGEMTTYEREVFTAAARASVATGAPITTHTDGGTMGDVQQALLVSLGVPAHRILIGHSCGSSDLGYHLGIARAGSYLGFDRFGLEAVTPDRERVAALVALLGSGMGDRVVVSHDSIWCSRGEPMPPEVEARLHETWNPTHFDRKIVPMLRDAGIADEQIEALVSDNPRRFFEGEAPGCRACSDRASHGHG